MKYTNLLSTYTEPCLSCLATLNNFTGPRPKKRW